MTTSNAQQKAKSQVLAAGIVVAILCVIAACILVAVTSLLPSEPKTVDEYIEEYGGNQDVYSRILSMTDCTKLQDEFDR